jgi:competence protein ComEC
MLLGRRSGITRRIRELFLKTGTAHILSVSGLHVAVLSAIIFFIMRIAGIPYKISSVSILLFLSCYVFFTGARAPIIRAAIMVAVFMASRLLERDFNIYSALSFAGILILFLNPMQAFAAGFVLSFACVFFICYLTPRLQSLMFPYAKKRYALYAAKTICVSISVFIGAWPIVCYYFNIVSPVSIVANIFAIPLIGAVLFIGILFITLGGVSAPAAFILAHILHILIYSMVWFFRFLSGLPGAFFYVKNLSPNTMILYYTAVFVVFNIKGITTLYSGNKD